jgi:hypothetical protein
MKLEKLIYILEWRGISSCENAVKKIAAIL